MPGYTSPEDEADKLRRMDLTRVQRGTVGSPRRRLLKALRKQSPTGPPMQMAHTQHFDDPVGYVNKFLTERLSKAKREATILRIKEAASEDNRDRGVLSPGEQKAAKETIIRRMMHDWSHKVRNREPGQDPSDAGMAASVRVRQAMKDLDVTEVPRR